MRKKSRIKELYEYSQELEKLAKKYENLKGKYKRGFKNTNEAIECLNAIYELEDLKRELEERFEK